MRESKASSDNAAVSEQASHVFGACACRDVKVFWLVTEEQIANAATHEIRFKPRRFKAPYGARGVLVDKFLGEFSVVSLEARASMARANDLFIAEGRSTLSGTLARSASVRSAVHRTKRNNFTFVFFNSKRREFGEIGDFAGWAVGSHSALHYTALSREPPLKIGRPSK